MKMLLSRLSAVILVALVCSCAATSLKKSWKSPTYRGGPVQSVAVVAIEDRVLLRQGFENRFVTQMKSHGQNAFVTHDLLRLPEIQASKEAAAARFSQGGADSILIVRLVDRTSYDGTVRASPDMFDPTVSGFEYVDWHGFYSVAFANVRTVSTSAKDYFFLETSLFDLKNKQRLWSGLTETVLKETDDRVAEMTPLVKKVVAALRKDGLIR